MGDDGGEGRLARGTGGFADLLVDESPDALFVLAVDGRVLSWNRGAQLLFGYDAGEAVGLLIDDLFPDDRRAEAIRALAHAVDGGTARLVTPLRRKDATASGKAAVTMRRVCAPGALPMVCFRASREPTRPENDLFSTMSHELRSPLNAIIGFTELMVRGRVGPVADQQLEYLGDILSSSKHLLGLINDIIDLARLESGKIDLRPERIDVAHMIGDVREILRGMAAEKGVRLEVLPDPGVATVVVDPARTKQALHNYLSNAIRIAPAGGQVTVRVSGQEPGFFRIDVEVPGVGARTDDPGTMLHLALTRRIVVAQGGRVETRSAPGAGSTFSAVLPRDATQLPAGPAGDGDDAHAPAKA